MDVRHQLRAIGARLERVVLATLLVCLVFPAAGIADDCRLLVQALAKNPAAAHGLDVTAGLLKAESDFDSRMSQLLAFSKEETASALTQVGRLEDTPGIRKVVLDLSATDAKNAGARGVLNFVEKRLEPTDILSFEFPVNGKIPDIALKSGDLFEVKSLVWSKYDDFLLRREFADTVAQVRPMVEALQGTSAKVTLAYRFPMTAQVRSVFAEVFGDLAGQIQLIDGF